jgi:hypothetical protein
VEGRITLARTSCQVHRTHSPGIRRAGGMFTVESHHILPVEFGGEDTFVWSNGTTVGNRVSVCPTGHTSIHELLRLWMRMEQEPSWSVRKHYSVGDQKYAEEGFRRWLDAGRPRSIAA